MASEPTRSHKHTRTNFPGRPAIFICRHGEREDYKWKARGQNWQSQAERPWDSPLSAGGHLQGAAAGRAIRAHCERMGLAPVGEILVSPLLRCAQTAAAAAGPLGVEALKVCPALAESMNESWYRSWAVPGADSTWGGPEGCGKGVAVDAAALHPAALSPSSRCLQTASELNVVLASNPGEASGSSDKSEEGNSNKAAQEQAPAPRVVDIDPSDGEVGEASHPRLEYTWHASESHEQQSERLVRLCCALKTRQQEQQQKQSRPPASSPSPEQAAASPSAPPAEPPSASSVLLVSHGGPTTHLYRDLTGVKRAPSTGYCGLFCYAWVSSPLEGESRTTTSSTPAPPPGPGAAGVEKPPGGSSESSGGYWECLLVADHEHLKEVEGATASGPNDMVEQVVV